MSSNLRHFSVEEARTLLKQMLPKLSQIVELKKSLDAKNYDVYRHQYFGGSGPNGTKHYPPELEELVDILRDFSSESILIKSLDEGLIDFPHLTAEGKEVYLCYKLGEDDILFWHPIDTGFAGRKRLDDLSDTTKL